MTREEKEVLKEQLEQERKGLHTLDVLFLGARRDLEKAIKALETKIDKDKAYSFAFLLKQKRELMVEIDEILDNLHQKNYEIVASMIEASYFEGFFGANYSLGKQGLDFAFQIEPEAMATAIETESMLTAPLYDTLGKQVGAVSEAVSNVAMAAMTNPNMMTSLSQTATSQVSVAWNKAKLIATTEGHRTYEKAVSDLQEQALPVAKAQETTIVKQWDSRLDSKTRYEHQLLDGQVRELGEPFEVEGYKTMRPGGFRVASLDIRCRCVQRSRLKSDDPWNEGAGRTKMVEKGGKLVSVNFKDFESYTNFKRWYWKNNEIGNFAYLGKKNISFVDGMDLKTVNKVKRLIRKRSKQLTRMTPAELAEEFTGIKKTIGRQVALAQKQYASMMSIEREVFSSFGDKLTANELKELSEGCLTVTDEGLKKLAQLQQDCGADRELRKMFTGRSRFVVDGDGVDSAYSIINDKMREIHRLSISDPVERARTVHRMLSELPREARQAYESLGILSRQSVINTDLKVLRMEGLSFFEYGLKIDPILFAEGLDEGNIFDVAEALRKYVGATIEPSGSFISTSVLHDVNKFVEREIETVIRVPKGARGVMTSNWKESELVLSPDTRRRVTDVKVVKERLNDGSMRCKIRLEMEVY